MSLITRILLRYNAKHKVKHIATEQIFSSKSTYDKVCSFYMTQWQDQNIIYAILLSILIGFLSACTIQTHHTYVEQSIGQLYNEAINLLEAGDPQSAAKIFIEVDRQHPHSIWATKAQLMAAYAFYEGSKYENAVTALDRFIKLHPSHKDIAYAYYIKGLCYYEKLADVALDYKTTLLALNALREVMTRFPLSRYARDSHFKLDLIIDHLAGKEMAIGRFYMQRQRYSAAINRFRKVVSVYQTTTHVPEALHRLVENYIALGLMKEAHKVTAVLGFNFPQSLWYQDSYILVKKYTETASLQ